MRREQSIAQQPVEPAAFQVLAPRQVSEPSIVAAAESMHALAERERRARELQTRAPLKRQMRSGNSHTTAVAPAVSVTAVSLDCALNSSSLCPIERRRAAKFPRQHDATVAKNPE
jgi:hypothetical protein